MYTKAIEIIYLIRNLLPEYERSKLDEDLKGVSITEVSPDLTLIKFSIENYERPKYTGQESYSVEVKGNTTDGSPVHIILFKDKNGHLLEMEIIPLFDSNDNPVYVDLATLKS